MSEKLVCQICGREFENYIGFGVHINKNHKILPKEYYDKYLKKNENICSKCGRETGYININKGYYRYCSTKCGVNSIETKEKFKQTNIERYGVETPLQSEKIKKRIRQTNIERYGVENPSQLEIIKKKKKQTCLEHYGVENPLQSEKIKKRIRQTNIERYGVETPHQSEKIKEKFKQTNIERYGVENPLQSEKLKEKKKQTCLERYGVEHYNQTKKARDKMKNGHAAYMNSCIQNPSKPQVELFNIIKELYESAIMNHPIMNYSVDIVIPELMIAFEYDGSYWHQDKEKDERRQREIEELGWRFIRYLDIVPSKEQIMEDINNIII